MRIHALAFGLLLSASACMPSGGYGPSADGTGGDNNNNTGGAADNGGSGNIGVGGGAGSGGSMQNGVSGAIASDTTWSGLTNVSGDVTVNAGVTLTIAAGAQVNFASGKALKVSGSLKVVGTAQSQVILQPSPLPSSWGGIQVASGGAVQLSYATVDYAQSALSCSTGTASCLADHSNFTNFSGLALYIQSSATFDHIKVENGGSGGLFGLAGANDTIKVTNSIFHVTGGDAVTSDSGNFIFQYNKSYGAGGTTPQIHCASHFDTMGVLTVDHNDFADTSVGFMASNMGTGSKVNYNNFTGNADVWLSASGDVSAAADLSKNYWGSATPATIGGNKTNQKVNGLPADAFFTTAVTGTGPQQ